MAPRTAKSGGSRGSSSLPWAKYYDQFYKRMTLSSAMAAEVQRSRAHLSAEFVALAAGLAQEFCCAKCKIGTTRETAKITVCSHVYCLPCFAQEKGAKASCAVCSKRL